MDADEKQFAVIYPELKAHGEKSALLLTAEIAKKLPPDLPSSDDKREKLAKRQANAAVAMLRMNQADKVWPLLRRSDQPEDPPITELSDPSPVSARCRCRGHYQAAGRRR